MRQDENQKDEPLFGNTCFPGKGRSKTQDPTHSIDFQGQYPARTHEPTFVAACSQGGVPALLLFDTGLQSYDFGFVDEKLITRFVGIGSNSPNEYSFQPCTIQLGPITALHPFPQMAVSHSLLEKKSDEQKVSSEADMSDEERASSYVYEQIDSKQLARPVSLTPKRIHVNGVSIRYLLGPEGEEPTLPYPGRLVAFWSTADKHQLAIEDQAPAKKPFYMTEQKKRELEKQRGKLEKILGHKIDTYAVPIQLRQPNSPDIPNSPHVLSVPVTFSSDKRSYVPRFEAVLAGVQPPHDKVTCFLDTGASYHTINPWTASYLGLSPQNGAVHTLPQVDIPTSNPPLSLLNIRVKVDKQIQDPLLLGIPFFDFFQTIIFDLGTSKNEGWIRFIR